jgi:hypothetical protein
MYKNAKGGEIIMEVVGRLNALSDRGKSNKDYRHRQRQETLDLCACGLRTFSTPKTNKI